MLVESSESLCSEGFFSSRRTAPATGGFMHQGSTCWAVLNLQLWFKLVSHKPNASWVEKCSRHLSNFPACVQLVFGTSPNRAVLLSCLGTSVRPPKGITCTFEGPSKFKPTVVRSSLERTSSQLSTRLRSQFQLPSYSIYLNPL